MSDARKFITGVRELNTDALNAVIARARVVKSFAPCARCHGVGTVAEHVGEHTMRVTCCDCGGVGGTHTYADDEGSEK